MEPDTTVAMFLYPENLLTFEEKHAKPGKNTQRHSKIPRCAKRTIQAVYPPQHQGSHWTKAYVEGELLGAGGFGCVFAGIRKEDGLPTGYGWLPIEIALMVLANANPCTKILKILDWYEEPKRYVVILERPEPCMDLEEFSSKQGGRLTEVEARIVMFQLMEVLQHCKSQGILHRDVKPENILIQTDTYHVKLFDFGCGDLIKHYYNEFAGTRKYAPREWFTQGQYLADPATVCFSLVVTTRTRGDREREPSPVF
ncbi:hypothetical protein QTP70_007152 [Hemibagrus guttatus]|uniref:non-specific serine/threonine protein kinase n=1 Tax=Hemibagrus guttatus TaxID=175788 RepID=A0AAE0QDW7_9TELE|nr:hypothetical protein QTP70_007152 [Hemibagrus guttatus]